MVLENIIQRLNKPWNRIKLLKWTIVYVILAMLFFVTPVLADIILDHYWAKNLTGAIMSFHLCTHDPNDGKEISHGTPVEMSFENIRKSIESQLAISQGFPGLQSQYRKGLVLKAKYKTPFHSSNVLFEFAVCRSEGNKIQLYCAE